jgi:hypothetical protein
LTRKLYERPAKEVIRKRMLINDFMSISNEVIMSIKKKLIEKVQKPVGVILKTRRKKLRRKFKRITETYQLKSKLQG